MPWVVVRIRRHRRRRPPRWPVSAGLGGVVLALGLLLGLGWAR